MFDRKALLAIVVMTLIYSLVLSPFIYVILSPASAELELFGQVDPGRNERSTPRSFVLPASPAVAFEQERKQKLLTQADGIKLCMLRLHDRGYNIGSLDNIFGVHVLISTLEFQANNELPRTGELDQGTRGALEC